MSVACIRTLLILLLIACPYTALALDGNLSSTEPVKISLEPDLLQDLTDGHLDQHTLLEASLIAGGIDTPDDLQQWQQRFATFCDRASRLRPNKLESQELVARSLLAWLHAYVLTGQYRPSYTELHRTLDTGHYNCITATILYQCLAEFWELPLETVAEPGHVYCRLQGANKVAIQTTSPQGLVRAFGASDSDGNKSESPQPKTIRSLSDSQLVAKIYYNRGIALLEANSFSIALSLLQRAEVLDPMEPFVRQNMLAGLNNWALQQCDTGQFEKAISLLEEARRIAPDYPMLDANEVYVYYCWTRNLCDRGEFPRAAAILDAAHRRRPDVPLYNQGRERINRQWKAWQSKNASENRMTKRVLDVGNCVPDHSAIKNLIESQFDATVDQAHGPEDTIAALQKRQYALVLINRQLDRDCSDGLEIIKQLKSNVDLASIPVMLITNFPEHQETAVDAGAEPGFGKNYLGTPETKAKLARILKG